MCQYLETLIEKVKHSSEWHASEARYLDGRQVDRRHARASSALARLAERLEALPPDDEHVVAYKAAWNRLDVGPEDTANGVYDWETYLTHHYGFDRSGKGDPVRFLEELTQTAHKIMEEDATLDALLTEEERIQLSTLREEYAAKKDEIKALLARELGYDGPDALPPFEFEDACYLWNPNSPKVRTPLWWLFEARCDLSYRIFMLQGDAWHRIRGV